MKKIKNMITKYLNNEISLKNLEDNILELMKQDKNSMLDDILEDIAYTSSGALTDADISDGLADENGLKKKLLQYIK